MNDDVFQYWYQGTVKYRDVYYVLIRLDNCCVVLRERHYNEVTYANPDKYRIRADFADFVEGLPPIDDEIALIVADRVNNGVQSSGFPLVDYFGEPIVCWFSRIRQYDPFYLQNAKIVPPLRGNE
jgi:hypothetical protein